LDLYEYQGKQFFAEYGIPVSPGAAVTDVVIFGGGIIPEGDLERLKTAGVKGVFTPGTTLETIIGWVKENVRPKA